MSNETAKQIISFVIKRTGKEKISESDFYLTLSMKLQWCSPNQAKQFINEAAQAELVKKKEEFIIPQFETAHITIPIDFKPTEEFFINFKREKEEMGTFDINQIKNLILNQEIFDEKQIENMIKTISKQKNIGTSIAYLLLAKKLDIDITSYIPQVKELIKEKKE